LFDLDDDDEEEEEDIVDDGELELTTDPNDLLTYKIVKYNKKVCRQGATLDSPFICKNEVVKKRVPLPTHLTHENNKPLIHVDTTVRMNGTHITVCKKDKCVTKDLGSLKHAILETE